MRKHVLLFSLVIFLSVSISSFGQIKVNSSGNSFFGNGSNTNNYGLINLLNDGVSKGISFTGESGSSFRIFKLNDVGYITRGGSTTSGMKIHPNGNVGIANNGALSHTHVGAVLNLYSASTTNIWSIFNYPSAYGISILSYATNPLHFVFTGSLSGEETVSILANGTIWAKQGLIQTSDMQEKSNVLPLKSSLDKILKLSAVSYHYKDDAESTLKSLESHESNSILDSSSVDSLSGVTTNVKIETIQQIKSEVNRKRIGLIAQEVEEVVPEVVRTMHNGKKGIMYSDLVSLLIEGMKELSQLVENEKNNNERQEEYIQQLEERIFVLEASLLKEKQLVENAATDITNSEIKGKLYQNTPNPFNKMTEIKYNIPDGSNSYIAIYDLNGRQLKKYDLYNNQSDSIIISDSEFAAGIYIYSLIVNNQEIDSKRMILTE